MAVSPLLYAWALGKGFIEPDSAAPEFNRAIDLFDQTLSCSSPSPSGSWREALFYSCAGPFVVLGERLGREGISQAFDAFGLSIPLDIRLTALNPLPIEISDDPEISGFGGYRAARANGLAASYGKGLTPCWEAQEYGHRSRLWDAFRPEQGEWEPLLPLGIEQVVLTPVNAQLTLDAFEKFGGEIVGYEVEALSGEDSVSWFIGIGPAGRLVVVLIEDSESALARELGLHLLGLVSDLDLAPAGG